MKRPSTKQVRRPLLAVDGDSFAHRAYHALPKTILGRGGRPSGAILGFANMLLRLYRDEQPRFPAKGIDDPRVPLLPYRAYAARMQQALKDMGANLPAGAEPGSTDSFSTYRRTPGFTVKRLNFHESCA